MEHGPAEISFAELSNDASTTTQADEQLGEDEDSASHTQEEGAFDRAVGNQYNDSALDDTIRFFRVQNRHEFDSDDSDTNATYTQSQINDVLGMPTGWTEKPLDTFIYIDDANAVEKLRVPGSIVHITEKKQETLVHAHKSEDLFRSVSIKAANIGMKVNQKKTQLLCVSPSLNSEIKSYIKYDNEKIVSTSELKILGFIFGDKPTVKPHIDYMLMKAKKKLWSLRHVKRAGLGTDGLLKFYFTFIRPSLEYAVPTFHPMLTDCMKDDLEYVQKHACKIIFGWNSSYDKLVSEEIIQTLEQRRNALTLRFAEKTSKMKRFEHWFKKKTILL